MKSMVLSVWTGFSQSTDLCGPKPSPKKYRCRSRFSCEMQTSQATSPLQRSSLFRNVKGAAEIDPDLIRNLGRRQSDMVVDRLVGSRHAELIDPQGKPVRADPSVPALCGGRFDRDTVLDLRRENLLPVTQILLTENLHARHTDHTDRLPLFLKNLRCLQVYGYF